MKISSLFLNVVTAFILLLGNKAFAAADIYFVHNDHLGTPQVLTNQDQNVVWQGDYKPFGEVDISINNVELDDRFPGQYQDSEAEVYYNYFRDYDPSLGRYIQSDPIGLEGGINTYGYVYQNPLSYIDPLGLDALVCLYPNAAQGFGHLGIGVNSDETYGFYPRDGSSVWERLIRADGDVYPDNEHLTIDGKSEAICTTFDTTDEQDKILQEAIASRRKNPKSYTFVNRNCSQFVSSVLREAGLLPRTYTPVPHRAFAFIQTAAEASRQNAK